MSTTPVDWSTTFTNERDDERIAQQQDAVEETSGGATLTAAAGSKKKKKADKNTSNLGQERSLLNWTTNSTTLLASPTPPVAALSTPPTHLELKYIGNDWDPSTAFPLNECEGDCDKDGDCRDDLICIQRNTDSYKPVPGCLGGETNSWGTDYCARPDATILTGSPTTLPTVSPTISAAPTPPYPRLNKIGNDWNPASGFPLSECEGDCDRNRDCKGTLICFQRDATESVPGCLGGETQSSRTDYCVRPDATIMTARPTPPPTISPTVSPAPTLEPTTASPTPIPTPVPTPVPTPIPTRNPSGLEDYKTVGREKNLGECEGDCDRNVSCRSLQMYMYTLCDTYFSF